MHLCLLNSVNTVLLAHASPSSIPCLALQWVIELDSTTPEKFSHHVIVRVPGHAFPDNAAVGRFVAFVTRRPEVAQRLMVAKTAAGAAAQAAAAAAAAAAVGDGNREASADAGASVQHNMAGAAAVEAVAAGQATAAEGAAPAQQDAGGHDAHRRARVGELVCIVDPAVYTKNRHFRLVWSSKGGKVATLEPTGRFAMCAAEQ